MYSNILKNPRNIVPKFEIGVERAKSQKYAIMGDETALHLVAAGDCQISVIDEKFYKSGFGLAFPEDWIYRKYFDQT